MARKKQRHRLYEIQLPEESHSCGAAGRDGGATGVASGVAPPDHNDVGSNSGRFQIEFGVKMS